MGVAERFRRFLSNIALTDDQKANGAARHEAVVGTLNLQYWASGSGTANSVYVGSWAKRTRIKPPRDVDVLFNLPTSVYERFQTRSGNRQSQLLQEVKAVLAKRYSNTAIRGDGPIVLIPFVTYNVELIPAFPLTGGGHWICMLTAAGTIRKRIMEANRLPFPRRIGPPPAIHAISCGS